MTQKTQILQILNAIPEKTLAESPVLRQVKGDIMATLTPDYNAVALKQRVVAILRGSGVLPRNVFVSTQSSEVTFVRLELSFSGIKTSVIFSVPWDDIPNGLAVIRDTAMAIRKKRV